MADALPSLVQFALIPQPQLVTHGEPDFTTLQLRKAEPRNTLLVQTQIPTNSDICLSLTLLEPFVVVGFDFDERSEDVLVLIRVLVAQENRLRFVIDTGLLEVLESSIGIFSPKILQTVDLVKGDLARAELLGFAGWFDQPGQKRAVIYKGRP